MHIKASINKCEQQQGNKVADVEFLVDGNLLIHNCHLYCKDGVYRLQFPFYRNHDNPQIRMDYIHPINNETRELFLQAAVQEYETTL